MKIFITGASGFIGSQLAFRLAHEDHDVTVLIRHPSKAAEFSGERIKTISGDIFNKEVLKSGMSDCDWVFHLAAFTRPSSKDPDLPYLTNVQGTLNVLDSAKEQSVKRVIITSSAGTLNFSVNGIPVDEETRTTVEYHTKYESTKAAAEKAAMAYCSDNLDVIIVNPTRVYGPGKLTLSNSVTRIMKLYGKGLWRFIPGDGEAIGNYAFISDVVYGIIQAAMKGKGGEKYILGGENISYREFFRQLGEVYGKERKVIFLPKEWLKRMAGVAAFYSKMTGNPAVITEEWIEKYLKNWIVSSHKATVNLDYKITPFREGAEKTVSWLRSEKSFI
jgi:nucleoside-diphosphate-sugar epimerase